jgi:hypothetical protein
MDDMDGRITAFGAKQSCPDVPGLLVEFTGVAGLGGIHRRVETVGRQAPALDDELPGPRDRFLLEVVAEGPIA